MESVRSGRRVCSKIAGRSRLLWRYREEKPPSLAMIERKSETEDGVEGCEVGMTIMRVRRSSSGDSTRWVSRCEATCNPSGRAGRSSAVRGRSGVPSPRLRLGDVDDDGMARRRKE